MDLNKVIIVGRSTEQPVVKTTPSGQSVTSFGVATNRRWKDKNDQPQEEVEFHRIVLWGRTAEVAGQYVTKGAIILIEGRIRTRSWKDKEGNDKRTTEIMGERLQLGPKPQGATGTPPVATKAAQKPADAPALDGNEEIDPNDLPF